MNTVLTIILFVIAVVLGWVILVNEKFSETTS